MAGPFFMRNALSGHDAAQYGPNAQLTGEDEFEFQMRMRDAQVDQLMTGAQQWPQSQWAPWRQGLAGHPQHYSPRTPSYDPHETWELLDNLPTQTRRPY